MADVVKLNPQGAFSAAAFAAAGAAADFEAARPKVSSGGVPFLRLSRDDGSWEFGQESIPVPADAQWGVFPGTFSQGFVCWKGRKLLGKYMSSIGNPAIVESELPPPPSTKRGWEPAVAIGLICVECPSDDSMVGTVCIFEGSSNGALQAWSVLFDKTLLRAKAGEEDFAPVIKLESTSYTHDEWDLVYKPVFKLVAWDSPEALIADSSDGVPKLDLVREAKGEDEDDDDEVVKPASRKGAATGRAAKAKNVTPEAPPRTPEPAPEPDPGPAEEPETPPIEDAVIVSDAAPRRRRRAAAE